MEKIDIKKSFRTTFSFITKVENEIITPTNSNHVKKVIMPQLSIDGNVENWNPLIVEFYDVAKENKSLWNWILNPVKPITTATICYFDEEGNELEELTLKVKAQKILLSDLDYSSTNESSITIAFDVYSLERTIAD